MGLMGICSAYCNRIWTGQCKRLSCSWFFKNSERMYSIAGVPLFQRNRYWKSDAIILSIWNRDTAFTKSFCVSVYFFNVRFYPYISHGCNSPCLSGWCWFCMPFLLFLHQKALPSWSSHLPYTGAGASFYFPSEDISGEMDCCLGNPPHRYILQTHFPSENLKILFWPKWPSWFTFC